MQIHEIARCKFYKGKGTSSCVIVSTRKNERLGELGIDAFHQLRGSQIFLIKRTGRTQWVWLPPEEASGAQRSIVTSLFTSDCIVLGALLFGPPGALILGAIGFKFSLKYGGGIGRIVPVLIESKCGKKAYIGKLPLWQAKKIGKIIKSGKEVEFREAEGNAGS